MEGVGERGYTHKKEVDPKEKTHLCYRKNIEDVKQDQKIVPDLLEAIMRPTDPVKEESWRISMEMSQFRSEIQEFRVCTFQMSGKIPDIHRRLPAGAK